MKFKDIEEGKLYQDEKSLNIYTKLNGLLYNVGVFQRTMGEDVFKIDMYYVNNIDFILNMNLKMINLIKWYGC